MSVKSSEMFNLSALIAHSQSELQMTNDAIATLHEIIGSCNVFNSLSNALAWSSKRFSNISFTETLFRDGLENDNCFQRSAQVQKAHQNIAAIYQDIGDAENAIVYGLSTVAIAESHHLTDIVASLIAIESLQALGDHGNAILILHHLRTKSIVKFIAGYLQSLDIYLQASQALLHIPFEKYCFDRTIPPIVKVVYVEVGLPLHHIEDMFMGRYALPEKYEPYLSVTNQTYDHNQDNFDGSSQVKMAAMIAATQNISMWVTRDRIPTSAFPKHKRKIRMFPLAVLEMAQWLIRQVSVSLGRPCTAADRGTECIEDIRNSEPNSGSCGCAEAVTDIEQCRPAAECESLFAYNN